MLGILSRSFMIATHQADRHHSADFGPTESQRKPARKYRKSQRFQTKVETCDLDAMIGSAARRN
ncbi:hypothetical protein PRI8871_01738 [Pseudoprimorskyibacter insulae]|uniref:Uncharacterized protein n=1 Tax=Pseudoprimorskyibacter insulae TaxID=1695997 RepID=A0A2R8AV95_9RHOB|nr:hypothetical protein PRI8871_01738 [Pseudoprimorskyibacter insulae]